MLKCRIIEKWVNLVVDNFRYFSVIKQTNAFSRLSFRISASAKVNYKNIYYCHLP